MTADTPQAFLRSGGLHGAVVALALFMGYVNDPSRETEPKILELVAGVGDDYMAKEAPALGVEAGLKVPLTPTPEFKLAPVEPVRPEPAPVQPEKVIPPTPVPAAPEPPKPEPPKPEPPKPEPVAPPKKVPPTTPLDPAAPDFKKKIKQDIRVADSKAKREIAKERAAETKRVEEEKKRMTKEEFDRANKAKTVASATTKSATVKKIDAQGIAKGVAGGSTNNKAGGAGGKALTSDNSAVVAAYDAMFKNRLRERFEPPPGLSDSLKVSVEVRSAMDGTLSGARVVKSSGSKIFDQAVLDAIKQVRMPPRPDKKGETFEFDFSMREKGEG